MLRALLSRVALPHSPFGSATTLFTQTRGIRFRKRMGRGYSHRMAMMKNMVTSLIEHERIKTGLTKAKELRRLADRMVTFAKRGDLHAHRRAARFIMTRASLTKLFTSAHAARSSLAICPLLGPHFVACASSPPTCAQSSGCVTRIDRADTLGCSKPTLGWEIRLRWPSSSSSTGRC